MIPTRSPLPFFCLLMLLLPGAACEPTDQTLALRGDREGRPDATLQTDGSSVIPPAANGQMPQFALPTLDGGIFDTADYQDSVLLINFWATWCAPCRVEIPDLIALQEEFGSEAFQVIGISIDQDPPRYVQEFVDAMEINYPVLIDEGEVSDAFGGVYALPTTFVVDKKGNITHRTIGLFPIETAKAQLAAMVSGE